MKFAKAMKKLKFWSRKNKKKKKTTTHITNHHHPPPPLPPPCHHCHSWLPAPVQPSAPPLPPWFEYDQTHNSFSASAIGSSQTEFTQQEIVPELNSMYSTSTVVPVGNGNTSYQQYMVPNPVYGVPVVPAARKEKATGFFGCVFNIGRHLIRCFCPCFHIREVD
ncbi:hypothetical protein ACSBR2_004073 [Camellia fascicularis]